MVFFWEGLGQELRARTFVIHLIMGQGSSPKDPRWRGK